jgi:hypothetical protein
LLEELSSFEDKVAAGSTAGVEVEARSTAEEDVGTHPVPGMMGPVR